MKLVSAFFLSVALLGANNVIFAEDNISDSDLEARRKGIPCFNPCAKIRSVTGPTGPCCTGPTGPAGVAGTPGPTGPCCTGATGPSGLPLTIYGQVAGHGLTGRFSPTGSYTGPFFFTVFPLAPNVNCPSAANMTPVSSTSNPGAGALLCNVAGTYRVTYSFSGNILNGVGFDGNVTASNQNPVYQLFIGIGKDAPLNSNPTLFSCTRQILDSQIPQARALVGDDNVILQQFVPITVSGDAFVSLAVNDLVVLVIQNFSAPINGTKPTDFAFVDAVITAELISSP